MENGKEYETPQKWNFQYFLKSCHLFGINQNENSYTDF